MYIQEDFNSYKYLIEAHDNFVILSNKNHISGSSGDPDSVSALYNYFNGYSIPFNYTSENTFSFTNIEDYLSNNIEDRTDFPLIFLCAFTIIFTIVFIINQLSKLVKKGGVFGSM